MHLEAMNLNPHSTRSRISCTLFLACLAAAACSQPAPPNATIVDPSPAVAKVELPHAVLPDGFTVDLELALTPQEVTDGLMFRPSLPEKRGMLFIFEVDRYPAFWMKNTLIPLDLIFLDSTGLVVDVVANVPPCAADPCPTYEPLRRASYVLELNAGQARREGAVVGATVSFELPR